MSPDTLLNTPSHQRPNHKIPCLYPQKFDTPVCYEVFPTSWKEKYFSCVWLLFPQAYSTLISFYFWSFQNSQILILEPLESWRPHLCLLEKNPLRVFIHVRPFSRSHLPIWRRESLPERESGRWFQTFERSGEVLELSFLSFSSKVGHKKKLIEETCMWIFWH